jgi:hypothetical protein
LTEGLTLLPRLNWRAMPWKNGGGVTHEIAVEPAGAGMDTFRWRVSAAEVRVPGPFSLFTGIDRTLAVLEGRLRLTVAGRDSELTPDSAPLAFRGDDPAHGTPLGGPVRDLNVMSRRAESTHVVRRVTIDAPRPIVRQGAETILIAEEGASPVNLVFAGMDCRLMPGDALMLGPAAATGFVLSGSGARLYLIDTLPAAAGC